MTLINDLILYGLSIQRIQNSSDEYFKIFLNDIIYDMLIPSLNDQSIHIRSISMSILCGIFDKISIMLKKQSLSSIIYFSII